MPTIQDKRPRLLVVEDEPMLLSILKEYFEQQGFTVLSAHTVERSLELLTTSEIQIVLTDLCLGQERDGGLKIVDAAANAGLPALLMTAYPNEALQEDNRFGKAAAFVSKPASCRTIQNLLATLVRMHQPPPTDVQGMIEQYAPWLLDHGVRSA